MKSIREIYLNNVSNPKLAELLKKAISEGSELTERGFSYRNFPGTIEEKDFIQIYSLLKERGYFLNETIVFDLVHGGYFEALNLLISDNYKINVLGENGENALFYLVKKYNTKNDFSERLRIAIDGNRL